jgi:hypothetical protein
MRKPEARDELALHELRSVLDETIGSLPERYREPIVICCLEGKSLDKAARELGYAKTSLARALAKARDLLRRKLERRGVSLTAGVLAAALGETGSAAPLPAALTMNAVKVASVAAARGTLTGGSISPCVLSLADNAARGIAWTKTRTILITLMFALLVGGGGWAGYRALTSQSQNADDGAGNDPPAALTASLAQKPDDAPAHGSAPKGGAGAAFMSGVVVDATGLPAPATTIWLVGGKYDTDERVLAKSTTDSAGRFSFPSLTKEQVFGTELRLPQLLARDKRGRLGWSRSLREEALAEEKLEIRLFDVGPVRGRVVAGAGKPIPKARLTPLYLTTPNFGIRGDTAVLIPELTKDYVGETAPDGSFVLPNLPTQGRVMAHVSAPGFGKPRVSWETTNAVTIRLERAATIEGAVTWPKDPAKAAGIKLSLRWAGKVDENAPMFMNYFADTHPANDGGFRFENVPPGKYTIFPAPGPEVPFYAEEVAPFDVKPGMAVRGLTIPLHATVAIRGRIVDKVSGEGIQGVGVEVYHLAATGQAMHRAHVVSNAEGKFTAQVRRERIMVTIGRAPEDYVAPGWDNSPKLDADRDTELMPLRLERAASLAGVVVDPAGKPLSGVKVHVVRADRRAAGADWSMGPAATSDKLGAFTLKGLDPDDTIALRARSEKATTAGSLVILPSEQKGPVRLEVSKGHAFGVRGVAMDETGRPIADAVVVLEWGRALVSKRSVGTSMSGGLQKVRTGANGAFDVTALWPGDSYRVTVDAPGYAKAESALVTGKAGQTHDFGPIVLVRAGRVVAGRVVDAAGLPVPGVRVFTGDAPRPVSASTDANGKFRLGKLYARPVYIFGQKEGFRFTGVRVLSGISEVTVKLLRPSEAPTGKSRPGETSLAEQQQIARKLLGELWSLPAEMRRPLSFQLVASKTRLDPAVGLAWAEQVGPRELEQARVTAAKSLAATRPDDTLALLAQVGDYSAYSTLQGLGQRYAKTDPARALRFAEQGVVRARALKEPSRIWALASLGSLVRKLGKDEAGRKLIEEAAAAADISGKDELALGMTAEALAPYDLSRALALLKPITEESPRERWLGRVAVALAPHDLAKALEIASKFSKRTTTPDRVRMRIAYSIAPTNPAKAVQIAESMDSIGATVLQAETLAWIAVAVAPTDKQLAYSLIDRSLSIYQEQPEAFRSWSNYGGRAPMAARVFGLARAIGYPDLESLAYRVLSTRPTEEEDSPVRVTESLVATALVLALAEPTLARQILEDIEPLSHLVGTGYSSVRREHLLTAWALADPRRAAELFDNTLAIFKGNQKSLERSGLVEMAAVLSVPPEDRAYHLLRYFGNFWFPGEE